MRLIHGDCIEKMKDIPDNSIDMVLCDPPYGTTACKWDSIIPLEPMWEQLERVIKPNGAIVMTAAQPFTTTLIASNMKMFKYCWVWQKNIATGHLNAKKMPMKNHEDILVFYSKQPTYNPQGVREFNKVVKRGSNGGCYGKSGSENLQELTGYPRTVQQFKSESKTVLPTQKPVALMEYLIKTYTNEGETVLDFAAGSFTTAIACLNTKRNFIGIELDDYYFEVGTKRVNEHLKTLDYAPKIKTG